MAVVPLAALVDAVGASVVVKLVAVPKTVPELLPALILNQ